MGLPGEDGELRVIALLVVASFLFLLMLVLLFFYLARRREWLSGSSSSFTASSLPSASHPARSSVPKVDVEEPLLSNDYEEVPSQISCSARRYPSEEYSHGGEVNFTSLLTHLSPENREKHLIDLRTSDELAVGQTLRFTDIANWKEEELAHGRTKSNNNNSVFLNEALRRQVSKVADESAHGQSTLILEVISGPSCGLQCARQSTNCSVLPLTLGRVSSNDMFLDDSGVSGKHAIVNWNKNTFKWELVDIGSLNGTLLNSRAVHNLDRRHPSGSVPMELEDGDIITLGSSSKILVQLMPCVEYPIPFRVGIASDPMALRRGGKRLPMEDALYCQWPLPGVEKFGLFGVFDGHGGAVAANTACKILPRILSHSLSNSEARENVVSLCDASEVLKEAFSQTEAAMSYQYEGCTATVLLIWADDRNELHAQCANVGDSACVLNVGVDIKMTEDHRISSTSERTRFNERGQPLEAGQTRLYGINISRMLGDKFIKEQDLRFSSEPYISQTVHIKRDGNAFALLASDGLWDVISIKRAVQLVLQAKAAANTGEGSSADDVAKAILNEARSLRTKDNTSVIFLDFDPL